MKRSLKQQLMRWMSGVLALAVVMPLLVGLSGLQPVYAEEDSAHPIIHQIYGGGGKSDTPFTHSYIELYNPTADDVSLSGWKLEYSSSRADAQKHAGSTGGQWTSLNLTGTLPAYSSYLIRGAAETTSLQVYTLDAYDQEWPGRVIDNDQYSLRLVNGDATVDQVAVKESGLEGEAIAAISKQQSVRRIDFKDTDNNGSDFENLVFSRKSFQDSGKTELELQAFVDQYRPRSSAEGAWGLAPTGGEEPGQLPDEDDTIIKIFHINDVHSRASYATSPPNSYPQIGYAQFKTFVDKESQDADGKLVLDAGDTFHGQSFASIERGASIAELLRAVGFDALSPGNHDFNYGWERLLALEELSGVPLLSANTMRNGQPLFETPTMIKVIDGVRVGLFGLTTPETAYKTNPNNVVGIDFGTDQQVVDRAKAAVQQLRETQQADIVIALTHLGDDASSTIKSTDIAAKVPGIDLIVDGHSHSNYPTGTKVGGVTIASTGEYFKNAGVVTIGYDKESHQVTAVSAVSKSAAELPLDVYPEDETVKGVYTSIIARQSGELNQVVGSTPIALSGERAIVRSGESNLGRLIADAMLAESGADVSITNGGGIRQSIAAGPVTKKQIIDVLPFGNYIITKSLTGAQIKAAIEQGMTFGAGSFPHFGGMEVTVEKYTAPAGDTTVEKGRIVSIKVDGEPISMTKSYVVATNDFMAAGGDGYTALQAAPVVNNFAALDEALIDYLGELDADEFAAIDAERRLILADKQGGLSHLGSYSTGKSSSDGGIAEIVAYNPDNRKMYTVNGADSSIDIVSLADLESKPGNRLVLDKRIDMSTLDFGRSDGFAFADITSIDINTERKLVVAAVQEKDYAKQGAVLFMDYEGNVLRTVRVGIQPDMVAFTPDGRYVLTADEGEPRMGYGTDAVDPKGSVSIIDLSAGLTQAAAKVVTFDAYDARRSELVADQVVLKKNTMPSVDLEPEYIAVAPNSKTAYISLQEANAIATLDIEKGEFTSIKGLGFKDHNLPGNELDLFRGSTIDIRNHDVYGVRMPDGLAVTEIAGKSYLLTPNEGDSREWGSYTNLRTATIDGNKFDALISEEHDGLDPDKTYLLGGRSFSIFDAATMELVFDSGSDFERITAERFPQHFNASNSNVELKNRSSKKGPEPEDVKVIEVGGKVYAAIGLERIGGVMLYDITDPKEAKFADYINTRDFSDKIKGDVSPEGLKFVKAEHSPTGYPLLLAAHEVSGTVAVYQLNEGYVEPQPMLPLTLTVDKQTEGGMSTYAYSVKGTPGAPTYTGDYAIVFQVYEDALATTPGTVLIKKVKAGANVRDEEIRISAAKKVKIMVVSDVDGVDSQVLAAAYGAE